MTFCKFWVNGELITRPDPEEAPKPPNKPKVPSKRNEELTAEDIACMSEWNNYFEAKAVYDAQVYKYNQFVSTLASHQARRARGRVYIDRKTHHENGVRDLKFSIGAGRTGDNVTLSIQQGFTYRDEGPGAQRQFLEALVDELADDQEGRYSGSIPAWIEHISNDRVFINILVSENERTTNAERSKKQEELANEAPEVAVPA